MTAYTTPSLALEEESSLSAFNEKLLSACVVRDGQSGRLCDEIRRTL